MTKELDSNMDFSSQGEFEENSNPRVRPSIVSDTLFLKVIY